ncbi:MAG: methyltransferase domain-containing protein [Candidatus Caldarchaeum sp.]
MNEPYEPAEDSFLLEDVVRGLGGGGLAAEVGCSTGYILRALAEKGFEAVGTDVNSEALAQAVERLKNVQGIVHVVNASILPFRPNAFDVVVANPPYLPEEPEFHDPAVHGGPEGWETAAEVLKAARVCLKAGGTAVLLASSLSGVDGLLGYAEGLGFRLVKRVEYSLFFERLYCFIFRLHG